jgi:hypothetical protein
MTLTNLQVQKNSIEILFRILNQDGFCGFIHGRKDKGKTDISLLLAEICYKKNFRRKIASNIWTESYMVQSQITNVPDLEDWLKGPDRKLFILDEAGKHLGKMNFMTKKSKAIMDAVQLIRHFDCGLIAITPAKKFIDSGYLDPDNIDFIIKKITRSWAKVWLYNSQHNIDLYNIPKTSINFNSKDIATLTYERTKVESNLLCCQIAQLYMVGTTFGAIGKNFNLDRQQVKRELIKHLRHSQMSLVTNCVEVKQPIESHISA